MICIYVYLRKIIPVHLSHYLFIFKYLFISATQIESICLVHAIERLAANFEVWQQGDQIRPRYCLLWVVFVKNTEEAQIIGLVLSILTYLT
jgi:hypothetical protein